MLKSIFGLPSRLLNPLVMTLLIGLPGWTANPAPTAAIVIAPCTAPSAPEDCRSIVLLLRRL